MTIVIRAATLRCDDDANPPWSRSIDQAMSETSPPEASPVRISPAHEAVTAQRYPYEAARIAFLCARDGVAAAADYCLRTSRIYRAAVLASARRGHRHAHFASLPDYRAKFIGSYCDFKRFHLAQRASLTP